MMVDEQIEGMALEVAAEQPLPTESDEDTGGSAKEASGRQGVDVCLPFSYDARSKPMVQALIDRDLQQKSRVIGRPPRAALCQVAQQLEQSHSQSFWSTLFQESVRLYLKDGDEGAGKLEATARLVLEAASREQQNPNLQRFLLFQALDLASQAVEQSEHRINPGAAGVCVSILKAAKPLNPVPYHTEHEVHEEMLAARLQRRDPETPNFRNRLARLYLQGGRYYEAYVQMLEFERVLLKQQKALSARQQGELAFRKGLLFQQLVDFHAAVVAGKEERKQVLDSGKLQAFVHRYNLRHPDHPLLPLNGTGPVALSKTVASLAQRANVHYAHAISASGFPNVARAHTHMAQNHAIREENEQAMQHLHFGMEALKTSGVSSLEKARQMVVILGLLETQYRFQGQHEKSLSCAERREGLRLKLQLLDQPATVHRVPA